MATAHVRPELRYADHTNVEHHVRTVRRADTGHFPDLKEPAHFEVQLRGYTEAHAQSAS